MNRSSAIFFLLVFGLSLPFYLLGAAGGRLPGLPFLPASALMAFVPMIAGGDRHLSSARCQRRRSANRARFEFGQAS
jgi:hypothetical protein